MSLQRPALDRRPGLALYAAVEEAVEALIKERRLAPGDALPAEQELQTLFGVSRATVRQALVRITRVRCANDIPIGIHIAYLPQEIVERAGFTEASLRADPSLSLYRQLEGAGVRIRWAEEYLRARTADRAEARFLGVKAGTPVMDVLRLTRYDSDRLMEVVR